ncbi:tRNA (guanosine(37)-N1)-methyltransferase TrmD [Allobranchiibius sp. GilTou73]|uniref:tRNA (guanosine(37)-N1)-methyltransferase TrmD n=1 Tax=Allobranchiibius sp. GilTou73 TaxID=2904523 RepID=UPI001F47C57C|nr:tRNA (guanosine(37)-N1)-methyltransferase TrmD [Allobranchiibius sp. GilTou73]UIJ34472.1 tRNA (guanosine(37)-N1)-methyltransferase TrmD [Allobranchiibius sp. GilTou73]
MRIDVVSIFPDYLAPLDLSLIGKARRDGLLDIRVHDLRDFTHDRHRTVDDTPYGGGAGMVMKPEPWGEALDALATQGDPRPVLIVPGPGGEPLTQRTARELADREWLVFACGRYEGIDERVYEHAADRMDVRVVSLGDYVLNGGEVAALAIIEAVARLLPGVIGNAASLDEESHEDGLLEYPVYTKPAQWQGRAVPNVLLSGDHGAIARWRREQQLHRTARRRPDLLHASAAADPDDLALVPAGPGDVGELLTLTHACWLTTGIENDTLQIPAQHETYESLAASLQITSTYVVRSHGRLVASARGRLDGDAWEIERVMVAPDLRGRGLGQWLLEQIEAQAPEEATAYSLFTGERSLGPLRMYRRAGYRRAGQGPFGRTVRLRKPRA